MGLDVYLISKEPTEKRCDSCGSMYIESETILFSQNITHNLGKMADKAGLYKPLWRPYQLRPDYNIPDGDRMAEFNFEASVKIKASELIEPIEKGLSELLSKPDYYKQFDSPNGWGAYDNFVPFVQNYLDACKKHPDATVEVSR